MTGTIAVLILFSMTQNIANCNLYVRHDRLFMIDSLSSKGHRFRSICFRDSSSVRSPTRGQTHRADSSQSQKLRFSQTKPRRLD